ncbi:hypothetical protein [Cupriavidus sp. CP313]
MPQFAYFSPLTGLTLVVEPTEAIPRPTALAETRIAAVGLHQADGNPIGSVTVLFGEDGDDIWLVAAGPIVCPREAMDAWERAADPRLTVLLCDGLKRQPLVRRLVTLPHDMVLHLRAGIVTLGGEVNPDAALAEHCSHDSDASRLAAGHLWLLR